MRKFALISLVLVLLGLGCSSNSGGVTVPDVKENATAQSVKSHILWGYWQGVIDPDTQNIEFIQLRAAEFHLNALPFLEPPPLVNLTLESVEFNGNIIEADIGLRHPFLGLSEFTGFDVCGIFISNGTVSGFSDPGLVMGGEGDTRLLNPDGYSRWWNPAEFPVNQKNMFSYNDGLLGAPDSFANYSSTLNGYKYFCDDLEPNDSMENVTLERRGLFSAGSKNIRHYTINIEDGLIFNYAVDASWEFPQGGAPWEVPDDFGPAANRTEAWRISVTETENTLYNDGVENGGDLSLQVDIFDWYQADLNTVRVESPGNFTMGESASATGGGEGYSTYQVDIVGATPAEGEIGLLISVVSEEADFQGFVPGVYTSAYFTHTVAVGLESPVDFTVKLDAPYSIDGAFNEIAPSIITRAANDNVFISYIQFSSTTGSTSDFVLSNDSGGSWFDPFYNTYSTGWGMAPQPESLITSMAIDSNGDAYHLLNNLPGSSYSLLVKFIPQPGYPPFYNSGIIVIQSLHGNSVIFSHDGYPIVFGDYADPPNQIVYKRGNTANQAHPPNDWVGWMSIPQNTAVPSPAMLSLTRNIVMDSSNNIHLVYFSSTAGDSWIRVASNTDEVLPGNWSIADVYSGTSTAYDRGRDPSIQLETDGDWHCAFVLHTNNPESAESVVYCRSTDGISWSAPVTASETPGLDVLDHPTVDVVEVNGQEIIVITYQDNNMIYLTFSWDEGETWQEPALLSTGSDHRPDTCVTSDGYVHTVWEHDKGTDYKIEYIRAHFVAE